MTDYTITAIITKIDGFKLYFKGIGDYFKKIDSYQRNVLLSDGDPEYLELDKSYFELKDSGNLTADSLYRELFIRSMLDKKPLKLTIEKNDDESYSSEENLNPDSKSKLKKLYSIIAVEVP